MSKVTDQVDRAEAADGDAPRAPGRVATSQPAAARAAIAVLEDGGNAVDAAVCAAACLCVVEPMSTGVGGDLFAQVAGVGDAVDEPVGLNGSGRSAAGLDVAALRAALGPGARSMPAEGIWPVTVPGAVDGWAQLVERFGTRSLGALLEPAVRLARDGFEVTPVIAGLWAAQEAALAAGHGTAGFLVGGARAPRAGERFALPALGATLEAIARDGARTFYEGAFAEAVEATSRALGGPLRAADLAAHRGTWVAPVDVAYRGHPVFELPPNGQGVVVLQALALLEDWPLGDLAPAERLHLQIEAVKRAFGDAGGVVADPDARPVDLAALLDEARLEPMRAAMEGHAWAAAPAAPGPGDTVHVAVIDRDGGACSLIQSLYQPFGARVVAGRDAPGDTGVLLQNRGACFTMDTSRPNGVAPGKRPYHTILPALAYRADRPWLALGVVGGFQQPQGQVQLLSRVLDEGLSVPDAVAAPRFRWLGGARVAVENGHDPAVLARLEARGHRLERVPRGLLFGGASVVARDPFTLEVTGAADPRGDGITIDTD